MKKTHKKVLGVLGLVAVIAITVFAAFLPSPETSAVASTVTDTVTVRVVGAVPDVNVTGITSGSVVVVPEHDLDVSYENVEYLNMVLKYTDVDGVEHTVMSTSIFEDYIAGNSDLSFDFATGKYSYTMAGGTTVEDMLSEYGFGDYVLTITGVGFDGVKDEDIIKFGYYPLYAEVIESPTTGDFMLDLTYQPVKMCENGSGEEDDEDNECEKDELGVAEIEVNVYDPNGNLIKPLSPIMVSAPNKTVDLPLVSMGMPAGTYRIEILAYNQDGKQLYKAFWTQAVINPIPVPDTGGLFNNLNISRTDYLVTGLIVFGLVAVLGIAFTAKNRKQKASIRNRRRK